MADTDRGLRLIGAEHIARIAAGQVSCTLADDQIAALPPPAGGGTAPATDPMPGPSESLHDRYTRMFAPPRRAHQD